MDVLNKLCSQVSITVSQISTAFPGNPVTREFDANIHIASAGPGLLWKVYKGCKNSTKQPASVFILEKRQLERYSKAERDAILDNAKKGVSQLTKIRHPRVLTVQHGLEESRESLAFATEPVLCSLANLIDPNTKNMPQPNQLNGYTFCDLDWKFGLLQMVEGLVFLHNDMKLVHGNICPENIILNDRGSWKLFGFDFCTYNSNQTSTTVNYPVQEFIYHLPVCGRPNLDYVAPECIHDRFQTTSSDMFSVGVLLYSLNARLGQSLWPSLHDVSQFSEKLNSLNLLNENKLLCVPEEARTMCKQLLSLLASQRLDAHQFIKAALFDDVAVRTLANLDSIFQLDNIQKSQFYKNLPKVLPKIPHRVQIQQVISYLSRDLTQPLMVPFVLTNILDIAENCTAEEYYKYILEHLKPVLLMKEPEQIMLMLMRRMNIILTLTPAADVDQYILPMLYRALDANTMEVQELTLAVLPTCSSFFNYHNVKLNILPRIKRLCISTNALSVRVNCLLCIGRLLDSIDKSLVLDEVLPFLPQIPSRDTAVIMAILGIYKTTLNHKRLGISKEIIATRTLPFLIPFAVDSSLTITQFNALVNICKEMFQVMETDQRSALEQLSSIREEDRILNDGLSNLTIATTNEVTNHHKHASIVELKDLKTISQQSSFSTLNSLPNEQLQNTQISIVNTKSSTGSLSTSHVDFPKITMSSHAVKNSQSNPSGWSALDDLLTGDLGVNCKNLSSKSLTSDSLCVRPNSQPLLMPAVNSTLVCRNLSPGEHGKLSKEEIVDLLS